MVENGIYSVISFFIFFFDCEYIGIQSTIQICIIVFNIDLVKIHKGKPQIHTIFSQMIDIKFDMDLEKI